MTISILGLGDSITVANQQVGTVQHVPSYRWSLARAVAGLCDTAAGLALMDGGVQFVGPTTQAAFVPPTAPSATVAPFRGNYADPWGGMPSGVADSHAGVGSETIAQVVARASVVTTYAPDAVVFECGTNDINQGIYVAGTTADAWANGVRTICALLPPGGCVIAVETPPLFTTAVAALHVNAEKFAREVHARVTTLRGEGLPVRLASIHRRLAVPPGFSDIGVHPSRRGFEAMAKPLLTALVQHLTGSDLAMSYTQQIELAAQIAARIQHAAYVVSRVWQQQQADTTGIYMPKTAETAALAKITVGASAILNGNKYATAYKEALTALVCDDAVVSAQYAAAIAGGAEPAAAAATVTDAAIEDAVYLALPRVWGITITEWAKPS